MPAHPSRILSCLSIPIVAAAVACGTDTGAIDGPGDGTPDAGSASAGDDAPAATSPDGARGADAGPGGHDAGTHDSGSSCTPSMAQCQAKIGQGLCGSAPDGCGQQALCACPQGYACGPGDVCEQACATCAQQGASCGQTGDGCGAWIDCGSCGAGEGCVHNECVPGADAGPSGGCAQIPAGGSLIGGPCTTSADCSQAQAQGLKESVICEQPFVTNFPNGFCTIQGASMSTCSDLTCPSGTTCSIWTVTNADHPGICLPDCQADADCRDSCYVCDTGNHSCAPTGPCLQANSEGQTPICH